MPKSVLSESSTEDILKEVGALLNGHFLLTSGLHSDRYIQGQKALQYPRYSNVLAERLVEMVMKGGTVPTVVMGPALGAIHWEVFVANALDGHSEQPIKAMFAERTVDDKNDPNNFMLRRGMELTSEDRVLVVEDVTTTGGSAQKVVDLVRKLGAQPVGVGAVVDRSGKQLDFGVPFFKLLTLSLNTYQPDQCPMCKEGSVAVKPGSSKR